MNKPQGLEVSDAVFKARKLKPKQEPLVVKSGVVLKLFKDVYQEIKTPQANVQKVDVPYNYMSCMRKLKQELNIAKLSTID